MSPSKASGEHVPARLSTYRDVHESRMDGFIASGFVAEHSLEFVPYGSAVLGIEGEVSCLGDVVVRVSKYLEVLEEDSPDPLVQTFSYEYNAWRRGIGNVLRHDNWHAHRGHLDEHHRHDFDWRTGEEQPGSPTWVGVVGWPTLSRFIEELMGWYYGNISELPAVHGGLGARG